MGLRLIAFVKARTILAVIEIVLEIDQYGEVLLHLPSGKFETNELVLELALIAYNLLRMIGQESLRHKPDQKRRVKRRRIRTVIDNIIRCASHVTEHARKLVMALGRSNTWRFAFLQIWLRFATA